MTIAKEAVYALQQRLKDLSINAPADQLHFVFDVINVELVSL